MALAFTLLNESRQSYLSWKLIAVTFASFSAKSKIFAHSTRITKSLYTCYYNCYRSLIVYASMLSVNTYEDHCLLRFLCKEEWEFSTVFIFIFLLRLRNGSDSGGGGKLSHWELILFSFSCDIILKWEDSFHPAIFRAQHGRLKESNTHQRTFN